RSPGPDLTPEARRGIAMLPLYHDPHFTFRFADDRLLPPFPPEGGEAGRRGAVIRVGGGTGARPGQLTTAAPGGGCWVTLAEPITMRAGEAFIAVPEQPHE